MLITNTYIFFKLFFFNVTQLCAQRFHRDERYKHENESTGTKRGEGHTTGTVGW